jgi:hypothetical protein
VLIGESLPAEKLPGPFRLARRWLSCRALMGTVVHAGSGTGVAAASGGGAESGRIAPGLGEHQPQTGFQAGPHEFSVIPGAAAYGRSACSASAVISGTLMSGASTGGTAIASTGGTASGPAADGRPSMAASAFATSASLKSASDGESAVGPRCQATAPPAHPRAGCPLYR